MHEHDKRHAGKKECDAPAFEPLLQDCVTVPTSRGVSTLITEATFALRKALLQTQFLGYRLPAFAPVVLPSAFP